MPETTAKIRAKGLDTTGVTEDIANQMYAHRGKHYMAIVEVKVEETHEKADGTKKVDLILTQVEPAASDDLDEHLRELVRTLYYNRGTGDQPTLGQGTDEPTVEKVLAAGAKHRPHPFVSGGVGDDDKPICDVCGLLEAAAVHSAQGTLPDPFEIPAEPEDPWDYPEPEGADAQLTTTAIEEQPATT
jgi:hypothetical protein